MGVRPRAVNSFTPNANILQKSNARVWSRVAAGKGEEIHHPVADMQRDAAGDVQSTAKKGRAIDERIAAGSSQRYHMVGNMLYLTGPNSAPGGEENECVRERGDIGEQKAVCLECCDAISATLSQRTTRASATSSATSSPPIAEKRKNGAMKAAPRA